MSELESASLPNAPDASSPDGSVTETTLRGEVEKLLFQSEDGAYCVLSIRDAQGNLHCVRGPITGAYAGQGIEVTGKWEFHREHGRRLKAARRLKRKTALLPRRKRPKQGRR